jgi:hypothetical protein
MRIIAAQDTFIDLGETRAYLRELKEGIILFGENSFNPNDKRWRIQDISDMTKELPMTLIGTIDDETVAIVQQGKISLRHPVHFCGDHFQSQGNEPLSDVSYDPTRKVYAIVRICAAAPVPYKMSGKADLLLIPTGGIAWEDRLDEILESHNSSLKKNGCIVQAEHHGGSLFIYSLKEKEMVGTRIKTENDKYEYIAHEI